MRISRPALLDLGLMFGFMFSLGVTTLAISTRFAYGVVLWPVDGVLLACMLQPFRTRPWAALATGQLAFALSGFAGGERALVVCMITAISSVSVCAVYLLTRRFVDSRIATDIRSLVRFLTLIVPVTGAVSLATAPVLAFRVGGDLMVLFMTAFASTWVGYAVTTPVALLLTAHPLRMPRNARSAARKLAILGAYSAVVGVAFGQERYPLAFLIPFGLIGVAYACDFAAVAAAVLITAVLSIMLTLVGHGPVALATHQPLARNLMLQVFLAVITAAALPIAALMTQHARLKAGLIAARLEAETASEAKSTFLATISHEIRTPLNGVLGMAQAMAQDALSPAQRERIEVLQSSGEALVSLLNDVLDLSKIEAGKLTLEAIDFDLARLLTTTLKGYEAIAGHKELTLELELGAAAGVWRGDPTRLRQIVSNLVSNALKFTMVGGVRVIARPDEEGLSITVADSGVGIASDTLETLFQKFRQADATTTRRFGGTGLGLAICRELVELMGGAITARSREGEGSDFLIRLPLARGASEVEALPTSLEGEPAVLAGAPGVASLRVLAAEDNATNQLVLRTLLRIVDVEPTIVENGVEAVTLWRAAPWDLVLMDVQMPLMDGPTATAIIRGEEARDPSRPRTPILALTANTLTHQVAEYLAAGMDGHLAKPISAPALFEALANYAARCDTVASPAQEERAVA